MNVVTKIEEIKKACTDAHGVFDKDQFRIRIVLLQLEFHFEGVSINEYYSDINKQLFRFLGPGHNLASCIQFMHGKKGQAILNRVKQDIFKDMSPTLTKEMLRSILHSEN